MIEFLWCYHVFWLFHFSSDFALISAFEGALTSDSFFGLTLLRKDFHLKLAVRASVEWGAASLIWERAQ